MTAPAPSQPAHSVNRLAWFGTLAVWYWSLSLLERLGLGLWGGMEHLGDLPKSMATGLLFDLVTFAWMALPITLISLVLPARALGSRPMRWLMHVSLVVVILLSLYNVIAGGFFWEEFQSRYNFIAIDYLVYTHEVIDNIKESYPLVWIFAGMLLASLLLFVPLRRLLRGWLACPGSGRGRLALVLLGLVPLPFTWLLPSGGFAVSEDRVANEIAKDNLFALVAAYRSNELPMAEFFPVLPEAEAGAIVRAEFQSDPASHLVEDKPGFFRQFTPGPGPKFKNVVLIVVESLDAAFLEPYGGKPGVAPRLSALTSECTAYDRIFATGSRTVRGLEAITLSIPPTPGRSIVKRPGCDSLDSIGWALKDHGVKATFLYGGYGYFDNMNFFFSTNGFHVVDRADLAEDEVRFANAWGVCDEDMLARSIKEARADHAAGQRFFQLVMTTSNHRPYTYPQVVDIPSGSGRDGAVQYTDFAIGTYLDAAAAEPWFVDTLFVITGDHCASSAGKRALNIEKHHIPLLLYAPGQMPAQRISTLGSQIDIAPTLIGLLDIEHTAQWFGHDLQRGGPPRAFVGNYQTLGLFDGQNLGYLAAAREGGCLAVDANLESDNAPFPEDLRKRTIAFYQVASHLYDSGALKLTGRVHDRVRR